MSSGVVYALDYMKYWKGFVDEKMKEEKWEKNGL